MSRLTCLLLVAGFFLAIVQGSLAEEKHWIDLFSKQDWYRDYKAKERTFAGKLEAVPDADAPSALQRPAYYKIRGWRVYTGKKVAALDKLVGKWVQFRGKEWNMRLEGQLLNEIWPGAVREITEEKAQEFIKKEPRSKNPLLYQAPPAEK